MRSLIFDTDVLSTFGKLDKLDHLQKRRQFQHRIPQTSKYHILKYRKVIFMI